MLSIVARDRETGNLQRIAWHVGGSLLVSSESHEIESVQADCDELMRIYDCFENIPKHRTKRVVKWYGDLAAFIVDNIMFWDEQMR